MNIKQSILFEMEKILDKYIPTGGEKPAPAPAPAKRQTFYFPVKYIAVTTKYSPSHLGVDFGRIAGVKASRAQNALAVFSGVCDRSDSGKYTGNLVRIRYDFGKYTYYAIYKHLKIRSVKVGQKVTRGQKVGVVGNTGDSTAEHLHFDLVICPRGHKYNQNTERKKYSVNPLSYLRKTSANVLSKTTAKWGIIK